MKDMDIEKYLNIQGEQSMEQLRREEALQAVRFLLGSVEKGAHKK